MIKGICSSLFMLLLLSGCTESEIDTKLLQGNWDAVMMMESDVIAKEKMVQTGFSFLPGNRYLYQGGPSYNEAGTYRIEGDLLYSTDTLAAKRVEKVVRIVLLTPDSLFLGMNSGGIKQEMRLLRKK